MCNYCTNAKLCYYHQKIKDGLIEEPEDSPEKIKEMQTVWDYIPLVRSQAEFLSQFCDLGEDDLCQQGYMILAELAFKIKWGEVDPPQISSYIKATVSGNMRRYIPRMDGTVVIPHFFEKEKQEIVITSIVISEDKDFYSDVLSPEETLLRKEALERAHQKVATLIVEFNERELFVLWNLIIAEEPMTMREIAKQFHTSKDSILRDVVRIRNQLLIEEVV